MKKRLANPKTKFKRKKRKRPNLFSIANKKRKKEILFRKFV